MTKLTREQAAAVVRGLGAFLADQADAAAEYILAAQDEDAPAPAGGAAPAPAQQRAVAIPPDVGLKGVPVLVELWSPSSADAVSGSGVLYHATHVHVRAVADSPPDVAWYLLRVQAPGKPGGTEDILVYWRAGAWCPAPTTPYYRVVIHPLDPPAPAR